MTQINNLNENYVFNSEKAIIFEKWIKFFDNFIHKKSESRKLKNVSKYLDGSAVIFFIYNCENFSTFNDFVVRFSEKHVNVSNPTIAEFVKTKLENYNQLMNRSLYKF